MASLNISLPEKVDTKDPEAIQKLNSYLYKLSEEIRYMFQNLNPEDNYSSAAYLKVVQSADAQASLEISLKQIELSYVSRDNVISSINLSSEGVKIKGKNIYLEGAITANTDAYGNPTFSVDENGFIHALGGTFKGDISASTITGSTVTGGTITGTTINGGTITGSHIYSTNYGSRADDFFITSDSNSTIVGMKDLEFAHGVFHSYHIGDMTNPVTGDDEYFAVRGSNGYAAFTKLYLLDDWYIDSQDGHHWDVTETLKWLDSRLDALEGGGGGCGEGDGESCTGEQCTGEECTGEELCDGEPIADDIEGSCG